jgi:ABC-2 type transport system ATP-binding protein
MDLEKSASLQLRKFSRGMLQRIGLAQALLNDPSLLLLDEPLGGLDPIGRKEVRDVIVRLKEEGKTVFLSSHILQDIEMICDRVAIIVGGEILNQGRLQDLVSENILFTELVLSGIPDHEFKDLGLSISASGEKILVKVYDEGKLDAILKLVHSKNGKIHSLVPRSQTLEDLFVGLVQKK